MASVAIAFFVFGHILDSFASKRRLLRQLRLRSDPASNAGGVFCSKLFSYPAAMAAEEQPPNWHSHGLPANTRVHLSRLSGLKRYKVSEVNHFDSRQMSIITDEDDPLVQMVSLRPGEIYRKSQLQAELDGLLASGMFEEVKLEGKAKPDGTLGLTVFFKETTWKQPYTMRLVSVGHLPPLPDMASALDADATDWEKAQFIKKLQEESDKRLAMSRPCLLPMPVQAELEEMIDEQWRLSSKLLRRITERIEKWYHREGYILARVVNFDKLGTRELAVVIDEGDISKVEVRFEDKLGNACEGNTRLDLIRRELPKQVAEGHVFNMEAARRALQNLSSLDLFSNITLNPRVDEEKETGIVVEINLKEHEQKSAEVSTEWSIIPGPEGRPTLASIQPGGTITFQRRNIKGLNRSLTGSVSASNLLNPQDDTHFNLEYVHPYVDGVSNPRNRTFRASSFNCRKLSPVFTGGPEADEVLPIWIDRIGFKATITENFTSQSTFTYGITLQEIKTCDETGAICTHGARYNSLNRDRVDMEGPATTYSGTGIDHVASIQANITRDNTRFVNGAIVGQRTVFQVDQGVKFGSKVPFYNRHSLKYTRFIQLKKVEEGAGRCQPPVLVLNGHYGGCVGDLPSYDAFSLGGPYSVRGYSMGELGACRNILEVGAELRIPVKNTHVYAFVEHGNDLGSSKDVRGNPTEFFRRVGHGSSYGIGAKLGSVRVEYAVDHNAGKGAVFFRFGERY